MLNILILTESTKYPYHTAVSHIIQSFLEAEGHTASCLDINSCRYDYECLNKINDLKPDVLITLDLAGFRFRTQAGETALNMLLTKNLNLLWGNKAEYASFLNKKISLSMLFYDVSGSDNHLMQIYPNLLYYKVSEPANFAPVSESDAFINQTHFQKIWTDFMNEVLLSEA